MHLIVPYANTQAGLVLTAQDYQAAGVEWLAFKFSILMVKPGLWREHEPTLANLVAWPHRTILDLSDLTQNAKGQVVIRSPYDGSKSILTADQIQHILSTLSPDKVIGYKDSKEKPLEGDEIVLESEGVRYVLTDSPLSRAIAGEVISDEGWIAISDAKYRMDTTCLATNCSCMTCSQALTRQYLHHLYEHTPNLCYRYLAIHQLFQHLRQR